MQSRLGPGSCPAMWIRRAVCQSPRGHRTALTEVHKDAPLRPCGRSTPATCWAVPFVSAPTKQEPLQRLDRVSQRPRLICPDPRGGAPSLYLKALPARRLGQGFPPQQPGSHTRLLTWPWPRRGCTAEERGCDPEAPTRCWSLRRCTTRDVQSPMGTRSGDVLYKRSRQRAALCFTLSMVSLKDRQE